jgi:hypothetical protein
MSITGVNLNAAKVLVGPSLVRLKGAADDIFTIAKMSDVGSAQGGVQGDVMLVTRAQFGYTCALTLMQASAAIGTLLNLAAPGEAFAVKFAFNDYSFIGFAVVQNEGEMVASLASPPRVITLAMAYVSGNVNSGSGYTLQV